MEVLQDALYGEGDGQDDRGDGGDPGNYVKREGVGVLAHEVFAIDEKQDEDGDNRQPNPVADLGIDENFPERSAGDQDNASTNDNENGIEPVERGGFTEFVIEASFEAHAFADDVGSGERKDGGGEERSVEQAEGKSQSRPLPRQRNQSLGSFARVGDVGKTGSVEGGSGANDDEEHDDHAGDAANENIESGLGILARADFFLDETGLEIKELPWSDGGANETSEHHKVASVKMAGGDDSHFGGKNPVWVGEQRGKKVAEIERAEDQENNFNKAVGALQNKNPDNDSCQGNANVFVQAEELAGGSDPRKFRDNIEEVDKETRNHDEEGGTQAELFTDEVRETFAGNDPHAGAHFHGDVEGDGHGDKGPEEGVAVSGPGLGVGADTTSVVIDIGGDDAGADDGKEKSGAVAPVPAAGEEAEDAGAEAVDEGVDGGESHGRRVAREERSSPQREQRGRRVSGDGAE